MPKIMVVAGEVSGDMQAARVIEALKKKRDDITFFGMGGKEMAKAGVSILYDPTTISTIGFIEALKHLRFFYQLLDKLSKAIDEEKPDLLFLVDYSGFNMKMARIGHNKGIPVVNYFSPSAWVWGKWRAKKMAKWGAKIAAVFPMEAEVYRKAGAEVHFVGHPLLDFVSPSQSEDDFKKSLKLSQDTPLIGLLPGSRRGEISSLLPLMLDAAELIYAELPQFHFVLPVASPVLKELIISTIKEKNKKIPLHLIDGQAYDVMNAVEVLICASGTASLEAACLKTPMVICYKTSWSTYNLAKLLSNVKYAGLPNIIVGREIVPELLQDKVTGTNLAEETLKILKNDTLKKEMILNLERVRQTLGETGAVERVADLIIDLLKGVGMEG